MTAQYSSTNEPLTTEWYYQGKFSWRADPSYFQSRYSYDDKPARVRSLKKDAHSKKLPGWVEPKSYYRIAEHQSGIRGTYVINADSVNQMRRAGNFTGSVGYSNRDFQYNSDYVNRAEIQAMLKIKKSDFNAAVALGEAAETAEMIGSTAKRLAKALTAVREKNVRKFVEALGVEPKKSFFQDKLNLRNKWLEHRYGWLPLLSDVDNAAKALAESSSSGPPVITGKGTVRTRSRDRVTTDYGLEKVVRDFRVDELCYVRLDFLPGNYLTKQLSQLGITNPLEVAWELLPLSFVADWFVPVGDYLSAFDYDVGLEFLSGSLTKRLEEIETISAGPHGPNTVWWNLEGSRRRFQFHRSVYYDAPFPSIPAPKSPLSFKHMADGLSLLTQVFNGRR